ncbi:hypothetical protein T09_13016 [Trichinella sp. T9]|nr:hypothetical protein T09_13016 [Trichinella sp. T9]
MFWTHTRGDTFLKEKDTSKESAVKLTQTEKLTSDSSRFGSVRNEYTSAEGSERHHEAHRLESLFARSSVEGNRRCAICAENYSEVVETLKSRFY